MIALHPYLEAMLGGVVIGGAVTLMLVLTGRVTGISGIIGTALTLPKKDLLWRVAFVGGLVSGGLVLRAWNVNVFTNESDRSAAMLVIAGLLVGYGTLMGSGCTSGHGVCGLSRLSVRSVLATVVFMTFGVLAATLTGLAF